MRRQKNNDLVELEDRALTLKSQGRVSEAAELFSEILRREPRWEHGYGAYNLACCLEDLGRIADARTAYLRALSHDPKDRIFLGGYASFLFLHGTMKEALEIHLELLALELAEGDAEAAATTTRAICEIGRKLGMPSGEVQKRVNAAR